MKLLKPGEGCIGDSCQDPVAFCVSSRDGAWLFRYIADLQDYADQAGVCRERDKGPSKP